MKDMQAHLERRCTLYLKLALPPLAFRSSRVLEVAAGLGQNSLYLACQRPEKLVLLEPNEVAIEQIHAVFEAFERPHTSPQVIPAKLEDYFPEEQFDIVLCENWLGTSEHELSLLNKLSSMVADQGAFVVTTISPIGFVPNLLRRFLAAYAAPLQDSFEKRTTALVQTFGSHLDTLKAMTRNKIDWVQDNMINPAYFGLALSIPHVIEELGPDFEVMGSCPSFAEDWRWFKSLHGSHRQMNEHFLSEYWRKAHNFLDHRSPVTTREETANIALEQKAIALLKAIEMHEEARAQGVDEVLFCTEEFLSFVPKEMTPAIVALEEMRDTIKTIGKGGQMRNMSNFSSLFGRETVYISFFKNENLAR